MKNYFFGGIILIRDYRFDVIRCISCLLIVTTHILQYHNIFLAFWTNSAVCTFFLLSGLLMNNNKQDNYKKWVFKRISKVLKPYYIVVIPAIIVFIVFFEISTKEIITLLLDLSAILKVPSGFAHLWFLTGIVIAYLVTPFLQRNKNLSGLFIFLIVITGLYVINIFSYELIAGLACYTFGLYFKSYILKYNRKMYTMLLIFTLVFVIANLSIPSSRLLTAVRYPFLGISMFYLTYHFKWLEHFIDNSDKKILLWFSSLTYPIYLVHGFFSQGPLSLLNITNSTSISILIFILVVFCISQIVHVISNIGLKKELFIETK